MTSSVKRDGDDAVIRIPMSEVHGLRVALRPVIAGDAVSNSTQTIRDRLDKALARLEAQGGH